MSAQISNTVIPNSRKTEPRRQPVQDRSRATVEAILVAAVQVFEKMGISGGTTSRIAEQAGVSVGTLYQYFPGKESILTALIREDLARYNRRLRECVGHAVLSRTRLRDVLEQYAEGILEWHSCQSRLQGFLLHEASRKPAWRDQVLEAENESVRILAGLLEVCPQVARGDVSSAAFFVIHTTESLVRWFVAQRENSRIKRSTFLDELLDLLESYLTCPRELVPVDLPPAELPGGTIDRTLGRRSTVLPVVLR